MHTYALALGANIGDREKNIERACSALELQCGKIVKRSKWLQTEPLYPHDHATPQPRYLNGCVLIESRLEPLELLKSVLTIEESLGRVRTPGARWEARTIDIDVILCDQLIVDSAQLRIPHPEMHKRTFVLEPLAEIAPTWIEPKSKKSISELLATLKASCS